MKVGFLIAGVQKGGTTSLHAYLRQHPRILMARGKEAHFFDDEEKFAAGAPNYNLYHRHFGFKPLASIYGEATPIYLYWSAAMRRIRDYNPEMKVVALLRNPIERAWSHWRMEAARKADDVPFSIAIRQESERVRAAWPLQHRVYSYLDRGLYSEQILRARRYFDDRQLLFIKSEEFFEDPRKTVDSVLSFLGVRTAAIDTSRVRNPGRGGLSMPKEDRQYLAEIFRKDIEQVEALLGWDCRDWLI